MTAHFDYYKPATEVPKPRLIVIGGPGIGKTTFGSSAPNVILLPTENGALGVQCAKATKDGRKCQDWNQLIDVAINIRDKQHSFSWLVLDTLNGAEELCAEMVKKRDFGNQWISTKGKEGFNSYGKGDRVVAQEMKQLQIILDDIQNNGMGIVLLAHVGLHKQANVLGEDFQKFGAELNKHSWPLWCNWADQVGYAYKEVVVLKHKGEKEGKAESLDENDERYLSFDTGPGVDSKARVGYEMPKQIPLQWEAYEKALGLSEVSLVGQILELIKGSDQDVVRIIAERIGGEITAERLNTYPAEKLKATIKWLKEQGSK